MKTLVIAALCFLGVFWGCFDVAPFRSRRRVVRRVEQPDFSAESTVPRAFSPEAPLGDRSMARRTR